MPFTTEIFVGWYIKTSHIAFPIKVTDRRLKCSADPSHLIVMNRIKFCPHCGAPLLEEEFEVDKSLDIFYILRDLEYSKDFIDYSDLTWLSERFTPSQNDKDVVMLIQHGTFFEMRRDTLGIEISPTAFTPPSHEVIEEFKRITKCESVKLCFGVFIENV